MEASPHLRDPRIHVHANGLGPSATKCGTMLLLPQTKLSKTKKLGTHSSSRAAVLLVKERHPNKMLTKDKKGGNVAVAARVLDTCRFSASFAAAAERDTIYATYAI